MNNKKSGLTQVMKLGFGIFMVLFYLGVAVLLARNCFGMPKYLSWFFAVVFGAYGIYRGYREVKGEHTYGMRRDDDEEQYMTYAERLKKMEEENNEAEI